MIEEIKKLAASNKAVIGLNKVFQGMKTGALAKVFVASNCPKRIEDDIKYYAALYKIEVVKLGIPNDELGTLCQKPFSILLLGVLK